MVTTAENWNSESAILSRAIDPQQGRWPPEASQAILSITLWPEDRTTMDALAAKAAAGTLSIDEELEIESYRQACKILDLLKARARVSLSQTASQQPRP